MKKFEVPEHYRSNILGRIKEIRKVNDPRKKDHSPYVFHVGKTEFVIPRHFGFCYGVENAIEIAFRTVAENPGKRIFLLGEMIHNPQVNEDLIAEGIQFLVDNHGNRLVDFSTLSSEDIVITPAFGTTVEIAAELAELGVHLERYNTTCPFVEKVWKRSAELGNRGYTLVVHGKYLHEETRATFSHAAETGPVVVVRNRKEAELLARYIRKEMSDEQFEIDFANKCSSGFVASRDLQKIGVVNQTTMLASETQEIAAYLRDIVVEMYGEEATTDTRDTLCYATNDNQNATIGVLESGAQLAVVVGGFNSSNTIQIATILGEKMPVYFVRNASDFISLEKAIVFNSKTLKEEEIAPSLLQQENLKIVVTSGASCPDKIVDHVIQRILELRGETESVESALEGRI
ncbi:MAG: 4-hydroxy-3-methylbut-2-enyl diphosphate reductase [Flavobacteriales bacterium]|jgi:4-hydroxy-3-methylbut-2-en-1-yl diphosphate reductase|nr:4-hydroxy-3-methylbut-2-enyl diphosphate reductase [Flavobacteriales bacterium]MDP4717765.1 4-hydroxy-3-methylbut-2-enyl diphosphate reductase [Flavobacteriales bacterium]MDP4731890.1 4-hydroxy-3-methylbut-2-enyl diphosphate reductase [Flavobacteriales bacterium]MDP4818434.1 4-hydroxy-3-methylbut-2-enyl diphosphate reductase [Flavobacteriales bacterium]MDP4951931.1 4-hydroxy-3-methylbut-2-enyl diphosphate reductase [Flavobacteriales bacterium]